MHPFGNIGLEQTARGPASRIAYASISNTTEEIQRFEQIFLFRAPRALPRALAKYSVRVHIFQRDIPQKILFLFDPIEYFR
jgi:hypothetical protein